MISKGNSDCPSQVVQQSCNQFKHHSSFSTVHTNILLLGGERSIADPRRVGLHNTNYLANGLWRESEPRQHTAYTAIAAGYIRIRSEVNVQHGGIGALHQNRFSLTQSCVKETNGVLHKGTHLHGILLISSKFRFHVHIDGGEETLMGGHNGPKPVKKSGRMINLTI